MTTQEIPEIVIGRLPVYLRALQRMEQFGQQVTSSHELGQMLSISPPQIRKDLSQFGEFGKQGTGYNVKYLAGQLRKILNLDQVWDMVIVGAGDVGHALARYQGFLDRGFQVKMIFDSNQDIIGTKTGDLTVLDIADMAETIKEANVRVALLAVPAASAQEVTDILVKVGIKAILNYAPIQLNTPKDVRVENIDPALHLQKMSFYLE
jgi:redox-sensing transcriptional repressor